MRADSVHGFKHTHCRDTPEEWITVKNNRSSRVRTLGMDSSTYHRVMDCCKTQQSITRAHFGHRVKYVTQESQNTVKYGDAIANQDFQLGFRLQNSDCNPPD